MIFLPLIKHSPVIVPVSILGIRPLMQRPIVDLPLPDGPAINIFSPRLIVKLMSCSVGNAWLSYLNEKFLKVIIGSVELLRN